jgi:cell division protein FtsN
MAQQRRNSGQARKRKSRSNGRSVPGWLWGVGGLAVGLFVALIVNLEQRTDSDDLDSILDGETTSETTSGEREDGGDANQSTPDQDASEETQAKDSDEPEFEFYKVLPEQEVEVPREDRAAEDGDTAADAPSGDGSVEPAPSTTSEPTSSAAASDQSGDGALVLQAGSFQDLGAADRMKAELALLGIEARIESTSLEGGETWHRVRAGPYSDRNRVNELRQRLRSNDIDTIILTRKE